MYYNINIIKLRLNIFINGDKKKNGINGSKIYIFSII